MKHNGDFRYDLEVGIQKEETLAAILDLSTIEVKYDRKACDTGNVFVEYKSRGKWSGISTSEATHYAYVLCDDQTVILPTDQLKKKVKYYHSIGKIVKGGDNDTSEGVLIPLDDFFTTNTSGIILDYDKKD